MTKNRLNATVIGGPKAWMVYDTNQIPLTYQLNFPPFFTEEDKAKVHEFMKGLYEEALNRPLG